MSFPAPALDPVDALEAVEGAVVAVLVVLPTAGDTLAAAGAPAAVLLAGVPDVLDTRGAAVETMLIRMLLSPVQGGPKQGIGRRVETFNAFASFVTQDPHGRNSPVTAHPDNHSTVNRVQIALPRR